LRARSVSSEEDVSVFLSQMESAVIAGNHTRSAIIYIEKNNLLKPAVLDKIKFHDVCF
jgi:hypothetical protein